MDICRQRCPGLVRRVAEYHVLSGGDGSERRHPILQSLSDVVLSVADYDKECHPGSMSTNQCVIVLAVIVVQAFPYIYSLESQISRRRLIALWLGMSCTVFA